MEYHQTLHLLQNNDPTFTQLCLSSHGGTFLANISESEQLGIAAGKNIQLELLVLGFGLERENLEAFFQGFVDNRSVKRVTFRQFNFHNGAVIQYLFPFFDNNDNLQELIVSSCNLGPGEIAEFVHTFKHCKAVQRSLQTIGFRYNLMSDETVLKIVTSMLNMRHLEELEFSANEIGVRSCDALADLMVALQRGRKCSLKELHLYNGKMTNVGLEALSRGLVDNTQLITLNLSFNPLITADALDCVLVNILRFSNHTLERLEIDLKLSKELEFLLRLNRKGGRDEKASVVSEKDLYYGYMTRDEVLEGRAGVEEPLELITLNPSLVPYILHCIGGYRKENVVYGEGGDGRSENLKRSAMYYFVKSNPLSVVAFTSNKTGRRYQYTSIALIVALVIIGTMFLFALFSGWFATVSMEDVKVYADEL